ncbi:MAG: DUF459 domain-containing protein [bacterium]
MDYMKHFKHEKKYSLKDVSIILAIALFFVLVFDSSGLYGWAKRLKVGKTRTFFVNVSEPLNSAMDKVKLTYPRKLLRQSFHYAMGKQREAGFIAASGGIYHIENDSINHLASTDVHSDNTSAVTYSSSNPLSVLLIGDSMMGDGLGTMLLRALNDDERMNPNRHYKVSSGLSRPDFYNWPAQIRQLFSQGQYDAVIIMMGTNDAQNFEMDGVIYTYGTEQWYDVYRDRLNDFLDTLSVYTYHVYWVGMPPMRASGYNQRMQSLNQLFEQACASHPRATYVSTVPLLGDQNGNYSTYITVNGRQILARGEDGIHMTRAGGQIVADELMNLLQQEFKFAD